MTQKLDPKDPEDVDFVTFGYADRLVSGETISGAVCTASVHVGTDPTPSAVLSGPPTSSNGVVTQWITGGVPNTTYRIKCRVITTLGRQLVMAAELPVQDA